MVPRIGTNRFIAKENKCLLHENKMFHADKTKSSLR